MVPEDKHPDTHEPVEAELVRQFAASPEAAPLADVRGCQLVVALAAEFFHRTIATLEPDALRTLIFKVIPHQAMLEASMARAFIDELHALYRFLARAHGLSRADEYLRVLDGNAAERLEAALADASNFGMAKSFAMVERDADASRGLDPWTRIAPAKAPPSSAAKPAVRLVDREAARAKKAARKATRDARKKSR